MTAAKPSIPSAGFTPGPWMMAAIPSSVVGWPVVQQGVGRSICSISYLPREANPEVYAQSEANARLIAAAPDLYEALVALVEEREPIGPQWRKAKEALAKARGDAARGDAA
jgi:hypothetical protein